MTGDFPSELSGRTGEKGGKRETTSGELFFRDGSIHSVMESAGGHQYKSEY